MAHGLVFYRNRIGMSFPCKECGLGVLNCFKNHFYEENKHAIFKSQYISSAPVILLVKFANSFEHLIKTMRRMHYGKANIRTNVALQGYPLNKFLFEKVSEHNQEIPQSHTAAKSRAL